MQAFYKANGCAPEVVSEGIVAAVRRGRGILLGGPYARFMYHLKRISRTLVRKIMLEDAKKNGYL